MQKEGSAQHHSVQLHVKQQSFKKDQEKKWKRIEYGMESEMEI